MVKSALNASLRNEVGSNACHRIRNHGHIPAVVYGNQSRNNTTIEIDKGEIDGILRNYGTNMLLELDTGREHAMVMIKDIQRHPVSNEIIHMDFQEISYTDAIHATIPIVLKGKQKAESKEGIIQQQLRELHVSCLPQHMPERIEVDISTLKPGHPLRIADIEFAGELSILNQPGEIIASLTKTDKVIDDLGEEEKENLAARIMKNE
ncbi:MAG: 50S ribosomal protein L25 [Thermotaleaceae bacterium]